MQCVYEQFPNGAPAASQYGHNAHTGALNNQ